MAMELGIFKPGRLVRNGFLEPFLQGGVESQDLC